MHKEKESYRYGELLFALHPRPLPLFQICILGGFETIDFAGGVAGTGAHGNGKVVDPRSIKILYLLLLEDGVDASFLWSSFL
jgi:hypothetical protein